MDLFLPWILSYLIDEVILQNNPKQIIFWGVIMLFCSIIALSFNIIANRMASRTSANFIRTLRHDLFRHISYLDAAQVDRMTISSLESRLTVDTYHVHQMVNTLQRLGIRAPLLFLGGITVSFLLDVPLTLVMVCTLPFIAFTIFFLSKKGIPLYTQLQQSIDNMTRVVRENASGIRIIKALRKTNDEKKHFDQVNRDAIEKEKKADITVAATNPVVTLFLNLGLTAVILFGAYQVYFGRSTTGTILAFMSYFTIISNALISLSRIFTVVSKGSAGMGRINKVFEEEPHLWVNSLNKEAGSEEKQPIHILFDHVTFSYSQASDQKALQDISFCLERGKTLGIMGETGSGKSTLISLILRIYDADSGTIQINGRNIQDIPTAQLRSSIGTVFQNDFLFSDTIAENIRFGRDLSSEEIDHALLVAQAKEFVSAYSDGTNHWLDIKGANLSGGQRQRLLIARAVAGRPEILILDDSSSALDYRTDATLRKALSENFQNITTILIAQRISSICHADQILMLEKGRCIGYGTHQELLERCPAYRKIYETQIGGICLE